MYGESLGLPHTLQYRWVLHENMPASTQSPVPKARLKPRPTSCNPLMTSIPSLVSGHCFCTSATLATLTIDEASYAGAVRHHRYRGNTDYRKRCAIRAGAEATVSEMVRAHGSTEVKASNGVQNTFASNLCGYSLRTVALSPISFL